MVFCFYPVPATAPSAPQISAVVIALNEGENLRRTVERLRATLPDDAEILIVDDGSTDGSTGFLCAADPGVRLFRTTQWGTARARNFGARHASGEFLVFADAHIDLPDLWWPPMIELLGQRGAGAVAPVVSDIAEPDCKGYGMRLCSDITIEWLPLQQNTPYPVALIPWCCAAIRRDTFESIGGFDEGMIRWGGVDLELSLRLWLLGYELWLIPGVEIFHLFREHRPYPVEWSWVIHNRLRLAFVHFDSGRISRAVEALRDHEGFASAVGLAIERDIFSRRTQLATRRVYDDEWFFRKFGPEW